MKINTNIMYLLDFYHERERCNWLSGVYRHVL